MTVSAVSLEIFEFLDICLLSSPPFFKCILPKPIYLIGCRGDMKGILKKKNEINKTSFLTEPIRGMKLKLGIHAQDISLNINCVYCSGRIKTMVVMETYSLHRLTFCVYNGKIKN